MSAAGSSVPDVSKPTAIKSARRAAPTFRCTECGASSPRWVGRCPECQAWGTVAEAGVSATPIALTPGPVTAPARRIAELDPTLAEARPTGVSELDRVLGGGLVPGSVVLLAGEPGIGKSTLLLEVAN
ncbi:MAG: DNA repair protein RadA, partial [Actinobacteria bacterium]|nr:DNA repair protein RadA [Actinomycetota bacterium]